MPSFADKVAIVTGGASGIGRALGIELVRHGARVVLADVNGDGAGSTARELSSHGTASAVTVDVADAASVEGMIADTLGAHGRIDYLFNNAGIALMGDARHMTLADWNRLIDVNLRGVIHGVSAAYPIMIRQGFGHIVNTASLAGLVPPPGATGYAMTKHAVVGLSLALRGEAAGYGVRVSVVCPGIIDTPIKYSTRLLNTDRETVLNEIPVRFYPAEACARDIVRGVARNRPIIVVSGHAKLTWLLYRVAPRLMLRLSQFAAERSALLNRAR
ncbi:MAG TPA: SDR family NAD(P)-dependent oxidoreductase [Candidatus Binatia bacterium]|nr:SDR family NAD(P)-dependent oxidoreductase [Candidatus Binatia bacterium]